MYKSYARFVHRYRTSSPQHKPQHRRGPKKFGLYGPINAETTQKLRIKKAKESKNVC